MQLAADESAGSEVRIPVRMLNEYAYCPRLFYIEFVQREFVDNAFTVEGRLAHRRVDRKSGKLPAPEGEAEAPAEVPKRSFEVRSVDLSSDALGITAKIDLVEGDGGEVSPVDYKRGSPPDNAHRAWEPERVQVCAYGLLLREHGYSVRRGVLYFAEAKTRVEVDFDEALVARTKEIIEQARAAARSPQMPPPLVASPKCQGCSLHAVCLPDETNQLLERDAEIGPPQPVRHFVPSRDDAKPVYVTHQGAKVGLSDLVLEVTDRERKVLQSLRLKDVSQLVLMGNVQVSAQVLRELMGRGVPVCWMSFGGWLSGLTDGLGHGNVDLRRAQFRAGERPEVCLRFARRFVRTKILNCRTMLRRNHREIAAGDLEELLHLAERAAGAPGLETLLGIEGNAARIYFGAFGGMLRPPGERKFEFDFKARTRRPPKDPINALLSFTYALLAREVAVQLRLVGLDPFLGFYHQSRFGRPALALDVMEEFRPLLADSVVISVVNNGIIQAGDFVRSSLGVALKDEPRREVIRAWERRLAEEVTHPVFGYRISYRRVLEVQARLMARHLLGELDEYPEFRTR